MGAVTTGQAVQAGEELLEELYSAPTRRSDAPTMGRLQKVRYTHQDMIDFIIAHPWASQSQIATRYGYTPGWISNVLASDAFQAAMAKRKDEIIDPELKASIEERFRALVIRSQQVLMQKLEASQVSDNVALRALELGARALGIGGNAAPAPAAPSADRLVKLAERLVDLQAGVRGRTYHGEAERVSDAEGPERIRPGELRELQRSEPGGDEPPAGAGSAEAHSG